MQVEYSPEEIQRFIAANVRQVRKWENMNHSSSSSSNNRMVIKSTADIARLSVVLALIPAEIDQRTTSDSTLIYLAQHVSRILGSALNSTVVDSRWKRDDLIPHTMILRALA